MVINDNFNMKYKHKVMKTKMIFMFLTLFVALNSFSQKQINVAYSDEKVKNLASEVYGEYTEYQTPELLSYYKEVLNNVEILEVSNEEINTGNYSLISTLILKNKYNQDLDYDKGPNFDINNFNPLKYFFVNSNADGSSPYYKIYKTNYLVRYNPNKK